MRAPEKGRNRDGEVLSTFQILIYRAGDHEIMVDYRTFGTAKCHSACHLERSVAESKPVGQMQGIWISRKNQYPLTNKGKFSYLRDPTFGRPTGFDFGLRPTLKMTAQG